VHATGVIRGFALGWFGIPGRSMNGSGVIGQCVIGQCNFHDRSPLYSPKYKLVPFTELLIPKSMFPLLLFLRLGSQLSRQENPWRAMLIPRISLAVLSGKCVPQPIHAVVSS
jgi:hypothetical protein